MDLEAVHRRHSVVPGLGCEPPQPRLGRVDLPFDTQVQGRSQRLRRPLRSWVLHQPQLVELARLQARRRSSMSSPDHRHQTPPNFLASLKRRGQRIAVADRADMQRPVQPVIVRRLEKVVAGAVQVEKINQEFRPFGYTERQYDMIGPAALFRLCYASSCSGASPYPSGSRRAVW